METLDIGKLQEASMLLRGKVIEGCVLLEWLIDTYITHHFVTSDYGLKREEMATLILAPRVSFESKFQIFSVLVDKYHPKFREKNKKYPNEIKIIIEQRNVFAHYPLNTGEPALEVFNKNGSISYLKFKNTRVTEKSPITLTNIVAYTTDDILTIGNAIDIYNKDIRELLSL